MAPRRRVLTHEAVLLSVLCVAGIVESWKSDLDLAFFGAGTGWAVWTVVRRHPAPTATSTPQLPSESVIEGGARGAFRTVVAHSWFLIGVVGGSVLPLVGGFAAGCCLGFLPVTVYELRETVAFERLHRCRFCLALPSRWRMSGSAFEPKSYWEETKRKAEGQA